MQRVERLLSKKFSPKTHIGAFFLYPAGLGVGYPPSFVLLTRYTTLMLQSMIKSL